MNLIQRVQDILLKPKVTWPVIAGEPSDVKAIYTNYLVYLAAIPAIATFIGMSVIGMSFFGTTIRVPFLSGLMNMVVGYVMSLVMVYVLALIANALAPTFKGEKDLPSAFKLVAYGATAGMVGGIFSLFPVLSMLGLLTALYSVYLIYTGIPVLMKAPEDKAVGYTAVLVVCGVVAGLILGAVSAMFSSTGHSSMMGRAGGDDANISIKVPGTEISINTAKLEEAGKKMEEASKQMEAAQASGDQDAASKAMGAMLGAAMGNDGAKPFAPEKLQSFVPENLAGMPRTSIEARTDTAMGLSFSSVEALYSKDSQSINIKMQDIGAAKMLALAMAAWASSTVNRETTDEVERIYKKDGIAYKEEYRKDGSHASLSIMLPNGVLVDATSQGADMDTVRAALASMDMAAIGALTREK
ncbi:Yip1 family protein [Hydrogenophaga sp. PAMC20947]|uniref:Yip1 family protein n=1 Tax=Hydrogenophaga sp. PAMC20947 TaxID=2565558 RepID=UPI00109DF382|nr:Yip1 family protein [Hydrogenophaga sp. PAMC20947]QCB45273.1 YIP1 family protein [Hydrogenophaga sp. PAMC20947]